MDLNLFNDPPKVFREVPFWSWNDRLEPDELRRQIGLIREGGWGGFFMHARVGLRTAYMGKQWMAAVRTCVRAAHEHGLDAWLYDEDKWPSGFAGGLSVAPRGDFRAQYLVVKVDDRAALLEERLATYSAREVDGRLVDFRRDETPRFECEEARVVQIYCQTMPLGDTNWFNGFAYLNLMNRAAVEAFIQSTHEVYRGEVGEEFGKTIPGLFTDEPCTYFRVNQSANPAACLPWVQNLAEEFERRRGYNLLPHLVELFFDLGSGTELRTRYHYWLTVTELFVENYTMQVADWCHRNGLVFTGHYMSEDSLLMQIQWGLAAAMPHYPRMTYPGVDKLGRQIGSTYGTILTVKQLDSAACQSGKQRVLIENYALGGQNFAHRGRKWLGDWGAVLGANLHNLHLALYSMRGERKRDCPPNLSFQQPWWGENRLAADYIARLSYALSRGKRVVDILVIHPIGSAWALYRPGGTADVEKLDRSLDALLTLLMHNQRDFHLGDEMLMQPGGDCEARVEYGAQGPALRVGEMSYRVVIVPPGVTLAASTVRLLREFADRGGQLLALEPVPRCIEGVLAAEVLPVATHLTNLENLAVELDRCLPYDARVEGRPDVWVHHRHEKGLDWFFLANTSLEIDGRAVVRLRGRGRLERWDLATGGGDLLDSRQNGAVVETELDFPPVGSHLLVLRPGEPEIVPTRVSRIERVVELDDGAWDVELRGPNALTLDQARLSVDGGAWGAPQYILEIQKQLARLGVGTPFALRFEFEATNCPHGILEVVMESPAHFQLTFNDAVVSSETDAGFRWDASFRRIQLPVGVLRKGLNWIELRGVFRTDSELESIYLTGMFGVRSRWVCEERRSNGLVFERYAARRQLAPLLRRVTGGTVNLTAGGLPFFAGTAVLNKVVHLEEIPTGDGLFELDNLSAAVARLRVNGHDCGAVAWEPWRWEVGSALRLGPNRVEIEITGTLRNLLGPHHLTGGDPVYTGPDSFHVTRDWTEDWILVPLGFRAPRLVWRT
jgi:hypothetical protein